MEKKEDTSLTTVIAIVVAIVCAGGWYSSAVETQNSNDSEDLSSYQERLREFDDALSEANNNIEEGSSCVDDAYSLFEGDSFDDGMSELDSCRRDAINSPGAEI